MKQAVATCGWDSSKDVTITVKTSRGDKAFTLGGLRPVPPIPPSVKFAQRIPASTISPGGYVTYDQAQDMIVSASAGGGPSENFSLEVEVPRAGTYDVWAMWASAVSTEVWVYTKPPVAKSCDDPTLTMDDAEKNYLPTVTGGWDRASLPNNPDHIGRVELQEGKTKILFTNRRCGGGRGGGRVPSTAWIEFKEFKKEP